MSARPATLFRALLAAALLPALAGCGGLFPAPPARQLYRPAPSFAFPGGLPHAAVQLAVATPSAAAGLDTRRIALALSPVSLDYYAGADWADSVPFVVRAALVEGFEESGAVAGVAPSSLGTSADFVLVTAIRDFEARYGAPHQAPRIEIALDLKLVALPQRRIVAAGLVHGAAQAAENKVPAIIAAFSAALGRAVDNAVVWTVTNPALSRRTAALASRFVHPVGGAEP
ncbi:MAG TPA: ABC-type transport auxiliary lipoprotein family protein [Stellaceae bacterium]|nr:ABC-type transport auxiliary lipoprotein family protein [Stellaceae bacterium]